MTKEDKHEGLESHTVKRRTPAPEGVNKKNTGRRKQKHMGLFVVEEWPRLFSGGSYFFVRGYSPTRKEGMVRTARFHGVPGLPYDEAKLLRKQLEQNSRD